MALTGVRSRRPKSPRRQEAHKGQLLNLVVVVERDADGYFAHCPALQGCYTQGNSYDEALRNIRDAIQLHLEDRLADGEAIPSAEAMALTMVQVTV